MSTKDLVLLTCRNKFFGQTRKPWTSLNIDKMASHLRELGYQVDVYEYHQFLNNHLGISGKTIIYSFSQKRNYREYIGDIIYHLSKRNTVIPSYDLLKCHENKGYQEIYKKEIGLNSLDALYFSSFDEIDPFSLEFPIVLKTTRGSNGMGVFLARNMQDLMSLLGKVREKTGFFRKIDLWRRKYLRKKKFPDYPGFSDRQDFLEYLEYIKVEENFVLQQFVKDLDFDLRVLIADNKYYVMKRSVKKGDFRASGTKLFAFSEQPDPALLSYAQSIYHKFDSPFLSVDILNNRNEYYLGEYQALHFGMSVVSKSKGYFAQERGEWKFFEEKPDIERLFAYTFHSYMERNRQPLLQDYLFEHT
jgi:hypothetical protein